MRYIVIFLLFPFFANCQIISVSILDKADNTPLIGATIQSKNKVYITDYNGVFEYEYSGSSDTLTINYIGYEEKQILVNSPSDIPSIILLENILILETMTITGSKYERRLSESTVSVDVLKPQLIENTNAITIDDALDKVSGVQMVDGQANIRGGSGYSYGAGSRVMLLVDDMPALQADAGFPNWGDMPVENIDQVEIVKGASSALYGSAAMNGIINIRTGTPTNIPQTKLSGSYTTYGIPRDSAKHWWGDSTRYTYVLSGIHKQKFGNLDVVGSIFHYREEGFNKATYDNRYRGGLKLKYRLSDNLHIGLNTLLNKGKDGDFFLWENSDERAVNPVLNGESVSEVQRYFIDPSVYYKDKYDNTHRLLTRYHKIENINSGNQSNESSTYFGEYQFQRNFEKTNTLFTSGIVNSFTNTDAELFGDTTFTTQMFAYYAQLEKSFFEKLNLSAGLRYEYNEQNTPEEFNGLVVPGGKISAGKWVGRLGASYEYMPFSSIRTSWGQGYRFPTITERFITTTFGVFQVRSNPILVPESGWTYEIGIKQGIKLGAFKGFIDVAGFTSRYEEMMEFSFGIDSGGLSFKSENVGNTKINGFEISFLGTANLGPVSISAFGGYTYIDPLYTNFENNKDLQNNLSSSIKSSEGQDSIPPLNVLKYRAKHNAKMDIQFDYKSYSIGVSYIKSSHMVNIDAVLEGKGLENIGITGTTDILGIKKYREDNNNGWQRIDLRASYKYKAFKISGIISNLTNEEYTVRPALLEAPINYSLRLDYVIDWKKSSIQQ